ncbi:hypothetical protein BJY04DRAFT_222871 [Aspergillus karnatakaensis]|uniref:uncharacterized protein n=1 Tax=Aspergillus karnatakaensis TaxID=1810916 RepID=UPI003CCD78C5
MVDPLSAAGLAYPVVKDLFRLAKRLRQAHREIKYAREDLIRVIERIEIVADAYELFHETMAGAKKNKALRRSLRKKRHLMEKVEAESARLLNTLERFTNAFLPLLRNDPLGPVERWISQYRWYRSSKKDVAPVLSRMRILEGSMGVIATLVIIQMLQLADERAANRGVSIQAEINNLRKSLDIGLKKLQDDQRAQVHIVKQRHASARDDISPSKFAQEVLRIVKKDIPKLYRQPPPDSPPTTGSAPSSNPSPSGPQPPSTPPSTPPRVFAGAQSPDTALSATVLPHREPEAYPVASQTQCEPDPQQHHRCYHNLDSQIVLPTKASRKKAYMEPRLIRVKCVFQWPPTVYLKPAIDHGQGEALRMALYDETVEIDSFLVPNQALK